MWELNYSPAWTFEVGPCRTRICAAGNDHEGTGNAARQAYLAAAVIAAVRDGEPVEDLLAHYTSRQLNGFLRHLQICLTFYQTGGSTEFWRSEAALIREGIDWTENLLREQSRPATHRLVGRRLRPL